LWATFFFVNVEEHPEDFDYCEFLYERKATKNEVQHLLHRAFADDDILEK